MQRNVVENIFLFIFLSLTLSLTVTSCLSTSKRNPSSQLTQVSIENLVQEPFHQEAYQQALKRTFASGRISDAQLVKELAGRAIWFKSAPNERHHNLVFSQKIGVAIDWHQAFAAELHETRFQTWGLINDPDCCTPGLNCDAKKMFFNSKSVSLEDTYGWDYCAGDENLLNALKQKQVANYKDPACEDALVQDSDALDSKIRENRCELSFGTSAGTVGFRKFPNPKFNQKRWQKIGGYKGYSEQMIRDGINNSIQPPFRVGLACAACHAAFDPLNTPLDLNHPTWSQIKGETGNQYINISKLLSSGMKNSQVETQLFTHTRPGTIDTSAVPHDFINDAGTMNAIINLPSRPLFEDKVSRWFQVESCDQSDTKNCQKVAYKNEKQEHAGYKYWSWQTKQMPVPHILKGGEDSVGFDLAVQRVYVNIGMCSESCWQNHLTNLRELDFSNRSYAQSPFNIAQCREQCASFRANEDRASDIVSFLASVRPTDLKDALKTNSDDDFKNFLESRYGVGSVARGQTLFSQNCAECHSSQNESAKQNFFVTKTLASGEIIRADWLGNDKSTSIEVVRTNKCRALHSNHMRGRVWEAFSSDSYKNLPSTTQNQFGQDISGGPGYYRNISLLNVWAHAPFMHDNSMGPEICGRVPPSRQVVVTSVEGRQLDANKKYQCDRYYDPSVIGRLELFDLSMDELLTPESQRRKKITRIDVPFRIPLGINDFYIEFPAGAPLNTVANFDYKTFLYDFTYTYSLLKDKSLATYNQYWSSKFINNPKAATELATAVKAFIDSLSAIQSPIDHLKIISKYYRTCQVEGDIDNGGHDFKTDLSPEDKKALKAFMATL